MTELTAGTREELVGIAARYPQARSGLLPMLHLVQSVQGYVTPDGIAMCAEVVGLTTAEVAAVSTFYTMYHRRPAGEYHVGVCINPGCGMLGGEAIFTALSDHLGIANHEVTADGKVSIERIECQAACSHAPVMTANWEFLDNMTVESAKDVVDRLRSGEDVESTRGPRIRTLTENERTLAGFDDGLTDEGGNADDLMLVGLRRAHELGHSAPGVPLGQVK